MFTKINKYIVLTSLFAFLFALGGSFFHDHFDLSIGSTLVFNQHNCSDHHSHPSLNSHIDCIQCQRVKIKEFDFPCIQSTKVFLQKTSHQLHNDDKPFRFVIHIHPDKRGPPISIS